MFRLSRDAMHAVGKLDVWLLPAVIGACRVRPQSAAS
jgi:hypothetical protein